MKPANKLGCCALALLFVSGAAAAQDRPLRGHPELIAAHVHIKQAMAELQKAAAYHHYDMQGHAAKGEQLLRDAEVEIRLAAEAANQAEGH